MKTTIWITLLLVSMWLLLSSCGQAPETPEEKQNPIPQIGAKLSHNYSHFSVYEATEKWIKYKVCSQSSCGCGYDEVSYFITCRNGNDEIIAIWNNCESH